MFVASRVVAIAAVMACAASVAALPARDPLALPLSDHFQLVYSEVEPFRPSDALPLDEHVDEYVPLSKAEFVPVRKDFTPRSEDFVHHRSNFNPSSAEFVRLQKASTGGDFEPLKSDFVSSGADFVPVRSYFVSSGEDLMPLRSDLGSSTEDFVPLRSDFIKSDADLLPLRHDFVSRGEEFVPLRADLVTNGAELTPAFSTPHFPYYTEDFMSLVRDAIPHQPTPIGTDHLETSK